MTVSPAKQFYYCFSCGAGGNSIKFLMEFQRQSFSDVVLDLARRYQVPVETVDGPQQERLKQVGFAASCAARRVSRPLLTSRKPAA
jgi:DNA primase